MIGWWWRRRLAPKPRDVAALTGLSIVLFFCHIVSWGLTLLWMLIIFARTRLRTLAMILAAFAPAAVLAAMFVYRQRGNNFGYVSVDFAPRFNGFWQFTTSVFTYSIRDLTVSSSLASFLFLIAAIALIKRRVNVFALLALMMTTMYFISPAGLAGGVYLLERLNVTLFLMIALWIALADLPRTVQQIAKFGVTAFSLILLAMNIEFQATLAPTVAEYVSAAPHIKPNSTILPLQFDSRGPGRPQFHFGFPMRHVSGYIAAERHAINLDNYEAETPLFPLSFRGAVNPGFFIGHIEDEPPAPRFHDYSERTPGRVDYVLLWDPLLNSSATPAMAAIREQLAGRYREVFRSSGSRMTVFERLP
jgi:hypothetical protein